ncbi:MAG TPA: HAD family phosphatase [Bryobacteraceae bacterium]|nr:HAD family phosphatase [Bryobacteraceae bacterium]
MHKTIIFDLGKVLVPFDFKIGYRALESACPYQAEEIPQRIAQTGLVELLEKGLIAPRDFVQRLSAALNLRLEYADFCRAWSSIFHGQLLADGFLESLAARYRMLLLSNTNPIHWEMIRENYPMLRYFHGRILSFEVHSMKPEPEIFRAALECAACRPEECFFTDDIADNVEAARREGLDAVQFQSPAQLEEEMSRRGIRWA